MEMTLWWRRQRDAGYHCDLILVPEGWTVESVTVGTYDERGDRTLPVSGDHAPVVADIRPS